MKSKKVFLSYCWQDYEIADIVDNDFSRVGIKLIRDIRDLEYQASIKEFVPTKQKADYSICIVSEAYIKSVDCMWEMMDLWKKEVFIEQICPIMVDSIKLDTDTIAGYAKFWVNKIDKLNETINSIPDNYNKMPFQADLEQYRWIQTYIAEFLFYFKRNKYLRFKDIQDKGLQAYSNTIFKRVGIKPSDNIEKLFQLSTQTSISKFEELTVKYLAETLIEPTDLFFYTRASFYERVHYYELAVHYYYSALALNNQFTPALESLVKLYISGKMQHIISVDKILSTLEHIDNEESFVLKTRGMLLFQSNPKEALQLFLECQRIDPMNEYIPNNIGCSYEYLGDLENAISSYKCAITINPKYYQAYNNLAIAYLKKIEIQQAEDAINTCLEINSTYQYGLETKGLVLEERNLFEDAISYYLKAINQMIWAGPFSNIGRIYEYEFCLHAVAKNYYNHAYSLDSESVTTNYNLGNYYRKYSEDFECAEGLLIKARNLAPNNTLCNISLGILYWSEQKIFDASRCFAEAYMLEPDFDVACFWISRMLMNDTKYDMAEKILCEFRTNYSSILIDFLLFIVYSHTQIEDKGVYHTMIVALWKDDEEYCNLLVDGSDIDKVSFLEALSEKHLSLSRGHIYKDSSLVPLINLENAYQYIKENFYNLSPIKCME